MIEKKELKDITSHFTEAFIKDIKSLRILEADTYPNATDHIDEMIEMIENLIKKGHAYQIDDGSVFFKIDTFSKYGDVDIKNSSNGAMPNLHSQYVKNFIKITGAEVTPKQAWTDIARFSQENIPAVNFGPGNPLLAHSPDEFVNTSQIVESYESIVKYLKG